MSDGHGINHFRKRRVRQYARRGQVYAWLRAYYSQVSAALKTGEQSWPGLVEVMARDGVTGRNSGTLTANAASKVWRRVERDIESEANRRAGERPRRKYPSRISPDWRPPLVSGVLGGAGAWDETKVAPSVNGSVSGPMPPPGAPMEFAKVDGDGNPLDDGKVFYRGQVMSRRAAEEIERLTRGLREEDRHR
jgi:hypothetical protein